MDEIRLRKLTAMVDVTTAVQVNLIYIGVIRTRQDNPTCSKKVDDWNNLKQTKALDAVFLLFSFLFYFFERL